MSNADELLKAIKTHGDTDIVISYSDVARYFPSSEPHPDSFEYKIIDHKSLKEWAAGNGFMVETLPEQAPEEARNSPPIHFMKV